MLNKLPASLLIFTSLAVSQPPYFGTIWDFPDAFLDTDPTALMEVTYEGREERRVFDRRYNSVTINGYLYSAVFNDSSPAWEIFVNPEFGQEQAREMAEKYSFNIGQMPKCIREGVSGAVIHNGNQLWGGGDPLTIHHGQGLAYESEGIVTETMIHEATHAEFDSRYYTAEWSAAANADGQYISVYARDNPGREDHSESFLCWLIVRYKEDRISESDFNAITNTIPNRLEFYDSQNLELTPVAGEITRLTFAPGAMPYTVQYHPDRSLISLKYLAHQPAHVTLQILDIGGRLISSLAHEWANPGPYHKTWNIHKGSQGRIPAGNYVYRVRTGEFQSAQSIILLPE